MSLTPLEATDLFAQEFHAEVDDHMQTGVPLHEWRAGGRRTKEYPDKEDAGWWIDHGPDMVLAYAKFMDTMEGLGWKIAEFNGTLAIELTLLVHFGNTPVKMGIDRVLQSPNGDLAVVDLKTGSRVPDSNLQLGFYACGMELAGLPRPKYGAYYMARKGELTQLEPLDHFTVSGLTEELSQFNWAVSHGIFLPHRGSHCNSCGVKFACAAMNGEQAHLYDPSSPNFRKGEGE